MYKGDSGNPIFPLFNEGNRFQYDPNTPTQLQLFGNYAAGCSVDPVNYVGNERVSSLTRPGRQGRDLEDISRQQKLQISLNNNFYQEAADRMAVIPPNPLLTGPPNPVSTGLRLSYDDDERNSAVTSASGSMSTALPAIFSLGDNLRIEINRQKEEFDNYIRVQEENIMKGVRALKQRHTLAFLSAIEKGVGKKLREKDIDIDNMNRKNKELVDRIKQVSVEAQSWHNRAKYNELMVNVLKNNLRQAMAQGADQGKEGCGDSEVDDAASYVDPNNHLGIVPPGGSHAKRKNLKEQMACKACKIKEVSTLLLPCRHLCMCKDCEGFIDVCPICQTVKTASVEVFMS